MEALLAWVDAWLSGDQPPNVWIGATVVNQEEADRDIPKLLRVPARVRFLSIEPMLGLMNIVHWLTPYAHNGAFLRDDYELPPSFLDWVIAGSESGPHARRDPAMLNLIRLLRDQCQAAGTAFHWKQDAINGKKVPNPEIDGRRWMEFPRSAS